jgi:hypothetical protein
LQAFFFSIPASEDETKLDTAHHELRKATAILAANATFDHVPGTSLTPASPTSPLTAEDPDIPFLSKKHRRKRSSVVSRPSTGNENGRNMSDDVQDASQALKVVLEDIKDILKVRDNIITIRILETQCNSIAVHGWPYLLPTTCTKLSLC